ncbi:cellulose biosynthesis protein BcsD [Xenophilus sp. Marseille-Q4582]|uniref:cellulose biosynthesis protein BcsD n=1 Tax=Xenophilus sp. Marseille-Q4582 TaxID=2866600 RepID=UPI001CE3FC6C|nr:cellulose biosynthesis protein BcsD [Xenophilus sp. Marseille-Q4582]
MDLTAPLLHYSEQAATPQWLPFHRALASELSAGLPETEIRRLFRRIGQRMAEALPVARCEDTGQLQQAFNAHWAALGWGVVVLEEQSAALRIVHACSPVARQFGPDGTAWAEGLLEGVYGRWFESQGLPPTLSVRALPAQAPAAWIELRLARNAA